MFKCPVFLWGKVKICAKLRNQGNCFHFISFILFSFLQQRINRQNTNPRTGICRFLAALMTSSNLSILSSTEQLIFFLLKVSDADPNTATSVAPAATLNRQRKQTCKTVFTVSHANVSAGTILIKTMQCQQLTQTDKLE